MGELTIHTRRPIAFDIHSEIAPTGRFVIVDGFDVSGGGIIAPGNYPRRTHDSSHQERQYLLEHRQGYVSTARVAQRPSRVRAVADRAFERRQIHHRHRVGTGALQPRPPRVRAGWRQHPSRAGFRPRLFPQRPHREHSPGGGGGQALCRRRGDLHHRVYFSVSRGPRPGAPYHSARALYRGLCQRAPRSLRTARSQGALRQGPGQGDQGIHRHLRAL